MLTSSMEKYAHSGVSQSGVRELISMVTGYGTGARPSAVLQLTPWWGAGQLLHCLGQVLPQTAPSLQLTMLIDM